ncbi:MAG: Uma2 family endonuclease, partial [Bacteroidota bacterium]
MFREKSEDYFAAILEDPAAPRLVAKLQIALELEQQRRQQFYAEIDDDVKAEFINGEIVMQSPVKLRHNLASGNLFALMKAYVEKHQLGYVGHEKL